MEDSQINLAEPFLLQFFKHKKIRKKNTVTYIPQKIQSDGDQIRKSGKIFYQKVILVKL